MQTICAWCGKPKNVESIDPELPISHGICKECIPKMKNEPLEKPVLGQEAVVPKHGLGRVTKIFMDGTTIEVTPYVCGSAMAFDKKNVTLVRLNLLKDKGETVS